MPSLRERVVLRRLEIPSDRGSEPISPLERTIWAAIEPGKQNGFRLVCRWSDLSEVTGSTGSDVTREPSPWVLEIEGQQFRITTIEPYGRSPRRFAAIIVSSLGERGNTIPFSSSSI